MGHRNPSEGHSASWCNICWRCLAVSFIFLFVIQDINGNYPWYYGAHQYATQRAKVSTTKCMYSLVVNEVKAQDCPQLMQKLQPVTQSHHHARSHQDSQVDGQQLISEMTTKIDTEFKQKFERLQRLEKQLITTEKRLQTTESLLKTKLMNSSRHERRIHRMEGKMHRYQHMLRNMEQKILEVMVNVGEMSLMMDKRLPNRGHIHSKNIQVESVPKIRECKGFGANYTNFKDCQHAFLRGQRESGVYYITPIYSSCPIPVWCDMDTPGGGWTVINRRIDGKCDFDRDWKRYREGFCDLTGEFWLGNDNVFLLSNQDKYKLRVDLWDFKGSRVYAEYEIFYIDGERDNYKLHVANYSGTAGDALLKHNEIEFSTPERDNDAWDGYHCAGEWHAGWWYNNCWFAFLTGPYSNNTDVEFRGVSWNDWKHEQLMRAEMKILPKLKF